MNIAVFVAKKDELLNTLPETFRTPVREILDMQPAGSLLRQLGQAKNVVDKLRPAIEIYREEILQGKA